MKHAHKILESADKQTMLKIRGRERARKLASLGQDIFIFKYFQNMCRKIKILRYQFG